MSNEEFNQELFEMQKDFIEKDVEGKVYCQKVLGHNCPVNKTTYVTNIAGDVESDVFALFQGKLQGENIDIWCSDVVVLNVNQIDEVITALQQIKSEHELRNAVIH